MERPTDAFKDTHNMVLANEDTLFGGLVSNLQVFIHILVLIFSADLFLKPHKKRLTTLT
ncbi:hypothetical protein QJS04_geneDACA023837 [Acorus gramineus]|uniref:Uncharacterized protein n=1 Tax=Acorus gramineus TaxID=55184 RepID=A0AAV9AAP2_ACOGR|nr:hypothetical protein QJS04_geneDACA023837 [Acorus gramineus]